jgi:hypothetical protein
MPVLTQLDIIEKPGVWLDFRTPHWDEPHLCVVQNAGLIRGTGVRFITEQTRACRQTYRQFVDRCQIVKRGWQHFKADWHATRCADQMQAPAKELLLFGSALAAVGATTHFSPAAGAHASADRNWQAIDHKHLASAKDFAQRGRDKRQPLGELV